MARKFDVMKIGGEDVVIRYRKEDDTFIAFVRTVRIEDSDIQALRRKIIATALKVDGLEGIPVICLRERRRGPGFYVDRMYLFVLDRGRYAWLGWENMDPETCLPINEGGLNRLFRSTRVVDIELVDNLPHGKPAATTDAVYVPYSDEMWTAWADVERSLERLISSIGQQIQTLTPAAVRFMSCTLGSLAVRSAEWAREQEMKEDEA